MRHRSWVRAADPVPLRQAGDSPTATRWIEGRPNPELVDESTYETMRADWHLLGRKFDRWYPPPAS